jgi:hypothetical protein
MLLMVCSAVIGWRAFNGVGDEAEPNSETPKKGVKEVIEDIVTSPKSEDAGNNDKGAECDGAGNLKTGVVGWGAPRVGIGHVSMRLTNMLGRPLFAEVVESQTQRLISTMMVMPGESVEDLVREDEIRLVLQTGESWCGMKSGWKDGKRVEVEGGVKLEHGKSGTEVIYVSPSPHGPGLKVGRAFVDAEDERSRAALEAEAGVRQKVKPRRTERATVAKDAPAQSQRTQQAPREEVVRTSHAQQSETRWLKRQAALEETAAARALSDAVSKDEAKPKTRRGLAAAQVEQGGEPIELQDWRNLPSRDMRVMTKGRIRMLTGSVGDEDVTFILSGSSMTTIGKDLAEAAGATGCLKPRGGEGTWKACLQVLPRISFGSVSLENVMVVVEPRVTVPVLGSDLVGRLRLYKGKDGTYLRVGAQ